MKKQSVQTTLLVLLLLGAAHGLAITGWRTVDYATCLHLPVYSVWFLFKSIAFAGVLVFGFCLFRLMQAFGRTGYFMPNSVFLLRTMSASLLLVSVANFVCSVWQTDMILPQRAALPEMGVIIARLTYEFVFEASAVILPSVLVFLLSAFVERALVVKSENEAFI